jgi:hypothetical protein
MNESGSNMSEAQSNPLDLVWGVEAIAKIIDRTDRQTNHMLASGQLPAKKVGGRWVVERSQLVKFFMGDAA